MTFLEKMELEARPEAATPSLPAMVAQLTLAAASVGLVLKAPQLGAGAVCAAAVGVHLSARVLGAPAPREQLRVPRWAARLRLHLRVV